MLLTTDFINLFLLVFLSGPCVVLVLLSEQKIEVSSSCLKMEPEAQKPNERDLLCGWRSYRPKFLQKLNTPKWFLVFLTIYSFMQGELTTWLCSGHSGQLRVAVEC